METSDAPFTGLRVVVRGDVDVLVVFVGGVPSGFVSVASFGAGLT
jgi:hypothetical protein